MGNIKKFTSFNESENPKDYKTILFTDHPDDGATFIIRTDAPEDMILDAPDMTPNDLIEFITGEGYFAELGPEITHIFDMPNHTLDKIWNQFP